jgi:hypothetical protein
MGNKGKAIEIINKHYANTDYVAYDATKKSSWTGGYYEYKCGGRLMQKRKYIITYDRIYKDFNVKFKNKGAIGYGDRTAYSIPDYAVLTVSLPYKRLSLLIQYSIDTDHDDESYVDESHYTVPAWSYSLYKSNDFDDNHNSPVYENLARAVKLEEDPWRSQYQVEIKIPEDYLTQSWLYVVISPIYITRSGGEDTKTKTKMDTSTIDIAALVKKIAISDTKEMSLGFAGVDDLDDPIPAESYFSSPTGTKTEETFMAQKVKEEGQTVYKVAKAATETTTKVVSAAGVISSQVEWVETEKYEVDSLDELPGDHWLRSPQYQKAAAGLKAAGVALGVGAVLASDGRQACVAYQSGDYIEGTSYATKATLGVLKEVSSVKALHKYGSMKALGSVKGQAALTAAIGTVEVGMNLYEASQTTDPIARLSCYEGAVAATFDTGIGIVACIYPPAAVIDPTWKLTVAVFSYFAPDELAQDVCSSPGSAFTFIWEYFATDEIPSQIAEAALEYATGEACKSVNERNAAGYPTIFIEPK